MNNQIQRTSLLIGVRAARANLVPALAIQLMMALLVVAFYYHAPTRSWLGMLAEVKQRYGYFFSFFAAICAGSLLPEILKVIIFQHGKIRKENFSNLIFTSLWWGFNGVCIDCFYRMQGVWFGNDINVSTVAKKVLVDQFIYTPLFPAPLGMFCYEWKNQGYSAIGMSRIFTLRFYKNKIFPALVAGWGMWIPIVIIIYSLPPLLQVPLFSLALTLWAMMYMFITSPEQK